jgi:hypothetical protein
MRIVTCGSILSVLLLLLVFQNPTVSAERGHAAAEFEAGLVQEAVEEAVDLTAGLPEDQKEMESLLHWAIGEYCFLCCFSSSIGNVPYTAGLVKVSLGQFRQDSLSCHSSTPVSWVLCYCNVLSLVLSLVLLYMALQSTVTRMHCMKRLRQCGVMKPSRTTRSESSESRRWAGPAAAAAAAAAKGFLLSSMCMQAGPQQPGITPGVCLMQAADSL